MAAVVGAIAADQEAVDQAREELNVEAVAFSDELVALGALREELASELRALEADALAEEAESEDVAETGLSEEEVAGLQRRAGEYAARAAAAEGEALEAEAVVSTLSRETEQAEAQVRTLEAAASEREAGGGSAAEQAAGVAAWFRGAREVLERVCGVRVLRLKRRQVVVELEVGARTATLTIATTEAPLGVMQSGADVSTRVASLLGEPISAALQLDGPPLPGPLDLDKAVEEAVNMPHDSAQTGAGARATVHLIATVHKALLQ